MAKAGSFKTYQLAVCLVLFAGSSFAQPFIKNTAPKTRGESTSPTYIDYSEQSYVTGAAGLFAGQQKATEADNQMVNLKGTTAGISYRGSPNASANFDLQWFDYRRYTDTSIGNFESHSSTKQTEFNALSSFKVLDTWVLGIGLGYHSRQRFASDETESKIWQWRYGFLHKSNRWEVGYSSERLDDEYEYWEHTIHGRYALSDSSAAGFHLTKKPQTSCCDMSLAERQEIGLSYTSGKRWQGWEMVYAYRPAYSGKVEAEIAKHRVSLEVPSLFRPQLSALGEYEFGEDDLKGVPTRYEKLAITLSWVEII